MSCVLTSHELANELLNKPNSFIIAKNGEQEYEITSIQRFYSCANNDDTIMNWRINLQECTKKC